MKSNTRKSKMISKMHSFLRNFPYFQYSQKRKKLTAEEGEEYCSLRHSPCTWYYLQQCCQEPRLPVKELFINDRLQSLMFSYFFQKRCQHTIKNSLQNNTVANQHTWTLTINTTKLTHQGVK